MKEIDNDKLNYLVKKYNRKIMFNNYDREFILDEYVILKDKIYKIDDIDYVENKLVLDNEEKVDLNSVKRINLELNSLVRIKGNRLNTVYKIIKIDYVKDKNNLLFTLDNKKIKEFNHLEKVGFNLNEINKVIITNPNIFRRFSLVLQRT